MKRQICTLALLGLLLVVGGIFMVAGRTPVSETERRQLAQWPQLTWQSLYTGRWMQDAEQAAKAPEGGVLSIADPLTTAGTAAQARV